MHGAATISATVGLAVFAWITQGWASPRIPPGKPHTFVATAYCRGRLTTAGTRVAPGTIAADPAVIPLGSIVRVQGLDAPYNGHYTVLDTGSKIRGRRVDLYMRNCKDATKFGRRFARLFVVSRPRRPLPGR